jgi:tetratricopeptide (TPR) repeat protein/tRNA A-37 threonylcarbamoyl transferase component Bud32
MECPKCQSENRSDSRFCRICGAELHPAHDRTSRVDTESLEQSTRAQVIGDLFANRYRLIGKIGEGGMGVVYKAHDTKLKRDVALKFLPTEFTRDTEAKERFIHEAQTASGLDHPNICNIHEIHEAAGSQLFISMACYEGETIRERIRRGPLEVGEALRIADQVAEGLKETHKKGIVHRDIKPGNVIIKTGGQAKIMDFGLAKLAGERDLTKTGTTVGTVAYMSPEQAQGREVDHRTDIWSLGVVLYEMITGKQPFKGDHAQSIIYSILNEGPAAMAELTPGLPSELEQIVKKCLDKDPAKRYQTIAELQADLRQLQEHMTSARASALVGMSVKLRPVSSLVIRIGIPTLVVLSVVLLATLIPSRWQGVRGWLGLSDTPTERWIAILPFAVAHGDSAEQAFSDGLVQDITGKIARLERLEESFWVMPARRVHSLDVKSPGRARRVLVANTAISGTMRSRGDEIELTLLRYDLSDEIKEHVDTSIVRLQEAPPIADPIANLYTWQDSVAIRVAEMLGVEIRPEVHRRLIAGGTAVPDAYESYLRGLGQLYATKGDGDADLAIELLSQAVERDPSYAAAHVGLGYAYWRMYSATEDTQWARRAVESCDHAVRLDPGMVSAHIGLGRIWADLGQHENALQAFRRALELDPGNSEARREMGDVYRTLNRTSEAAAAYQEVVESRPRDWSTYYALGEMYYYEGDRQSALGLFSKVMELRPDSPSSYNIVGVAYAELGRERDAIAMFEKSLDIDTTYQACSNLGTLYFWKWRYADATEMYKKTVELAPTYYVAWGHLGEACYWDPGQKDEAAGAFRKAIELAETQPDVDLDDPSVLADLAGYHGRLGDDSKAEALVKRAVACKPSGQDVSLHIAEAYEMIGDRGAALEWISRAMADGASRARIISYPGLSKLRADERFQELLKQVGDRS